jgi:nitrogenase molybdenum-iron protein NifN
MKRETKQSFAAVNPCRLCAPLGAALAFAGVEGAMTLLHGSQGCATYIRRFLISHFREPIDIASSSFAEDEAIFGGAAALEQAVSNMIAQYHPRLIGIATTCVAETIGEDVARYAREIGARLDSGAGPVLVPVSTPSYKGSHAEGYHAALYRIVETLARPGAASDRINIVAGMISPADFRFLREVCNGFGVIATILPDYSETLDGGIWEHNRGLPDGGTGINDIRAMGSASNTLSLGRGVPDMSAGDFLERTFGVRHSRLGLPIGIQATDAFMNALAAACGKPVPARYAAERSRLIDAYVDGHKYVFGKRAVIYGDPDAVVALAGFCGEIGMVPALCATGSAAPGLAARIGEAVPESDGPVTVLDKTDFDGISDAASAAGADILIGSSKGNFIAGRLDVPLVRVFFPVHDRIGGQRLLHLGYRGAQELFDRIVNEILDKRQRASKAEYAYM